MRVRKDDMERLPEGFSSRAAKTEDLGVIADIVMQSDANGFFEPETVERGISEVLREVDLENDSLLVFAGDGTPVAMASLNKHDSTRIDGRAAVRSSCVGKGIGGALVGFVEERAREHVSRSSRETNLYMIVDATSERANRLLMKKRYERVRRFWIMEKKLEDETSPVWPEGISVRTMSPGEERDIYAIEIETFEDHWHGEDEPESFESWSRYNLECEDHDPSLWFVAEDAGEIAGICLCNARSAELGWVEVLGVRRAWRGRGLGKSLLRLAFTEFQRRGMKKTRLSVDSESLTGATRLYERAGMHTTKRSVLYRKVISPPN